MNKLILVAISLILLGLPNAQARNSAASYDNKFYSQQEFVQAYNDTTAPMYRDYVVGLDVGATGIANANTPTINPNNNLGQYITEATGSTTDNIYAFGVVDDTVIPAGQLGRICIRGPHKVVVATAASGRNNLFTVSVGTVLSQCANMVVQTNPTGSNPVNGGYACAYSTATGTAASMIGYVISNTATSDTYDQGTATVSGTNFQNAVSATGNEYWAWITPQVLR